MCVVAHLVALHWMASAAARLAAGLGPVLRGASLRAAGRAALLAAGLPAEIAAAGSAAAGLRLLAAIPPPASEKKYLLNTIPMGRSQSPAACCQATALEPPGGDGRLRHAASTRPRGRGLQRVGHARANAQMDSEWTPITLSHDSTRQHAIPLAWRKGQQNGRKVSQGSTGQWWATLELNQRRPARPARAQVTLTCTAPDSPANSLRRRRYADETGAISPRLGTIRRRASRTSERVAAATPESAP